MEFATPEKAVGESFCNKKEKLMVETNRVHAKVVRSFLHRHHVAIVIALSLSHIGLALVPSRDSGRADL